MTAFAGFPPGKTRFTPIPDLFYSELLPAIRDLNELKLTLYMFWSLNRQRGYPRYVTVSELEAESLLLSSLQCEAGEATRALHEAVKKAVDRGTLLRLTIGSDTEETDYFFVNTPQGRKAIEEVKRGELLLETTGHVHEPYVEPDRSNIFELYDQNIGFLQPLLAEELQEAEQTYPAVWIVDAFKIAAEHNVRNWRYIRSILERWAREGKNDGGRGRSGGVRRKRRS